MEAHEYPLEVQHPDELEADDESETDGSPKKSQRHVYKGAIKPTKSNTVMQAFVGDDDASEHVN